MVRIAMEETKMNNKVLALIVLIAIPAFLILGCDQNRAKSWVENTQRFSVEAAKIADLTVSTHNGAIDITGADTSELSVSVVCKAGGRNELDAQSALDAIELVSRTTDADSYELGWKWREPRKTGWSGEVRFQVQVPAGLVINAVTHNGEIEVRDTTAACDLKTHNGRLIVDGGKDVLKAHTHNGRVEVASQATRMDVSSHNGSVTIDASKCPTLGGKIGCHNGSIKIAMGENTASDVSVCTQNGRISCDVPWRVSSSKSKNRIQGSFGEGGPSLDVQAHNGSVKIVKGKT